MTPRALKAANGWLTIFWILNIPIVFVLGWEASVPYLVIVSLWANIASHLAGWVAGRVEVTQDENS